MKSSKFYLKEDNRSIRTILKLVNEKIKKARKDKKLSKEQLNVILDFKDNYLSVFDDFDMIDREEIPFDYEKLILEKIAEIINLLE